MYGKECFIEKADAETIKEGDKITLMKWGNVNISKKETLADGTFHLTGNVDEKDMDFKKTAKLHWLCADPSTYVEIKTVSLGHLINKKKVEDDDKIEDLFNRESYVTTTSYTEGCVKNLQKGDSFQFERRGYYIVDSIALHDKPMKVIFIPDGKENSMSKNIKNDVNLNVDKGKNKVK